MTQSQPHHEERGIPGRRAGCETSQQHRENLRAALIAFHTATGEAEARRNKLKSLIESGHSNQEAAEALGTTKGAVGKLIYRMRKDGVVINRPLPVVKAKAPKPAKKPWVRSTKPTPPQPRQRIKHPPMTPVGLLERTGCCFPVNDGKPFLFCDNAKHERSSYCLFHGNLMFQGRAE